MAEFKYLTDNIVEALDLLGNNHRNLPLGGLVSSIIEFLGRCLVSPRSQNSLDNFCRFAEEFLAPINPKYAKYKKLLHQDLRCGSAHTIMPKGGVALSYDPNSKELHLQIIRDYPTGNFRLWLYSPQLIEDIKESITKFIQKAREVPELEKRYKDTVIELAKEGQRNIQDYVPGEDLSNAKVIHEKGDIIL